MSLLKGIRFGLIVCIPLWITFAVLVIQSMASHVPPPPIGSNIGDSDTTLTPGVSAPIALFSSALTVPRTITLSTTGARAGTTFRIVRSGAGVGTLNIGGVVTLITLVPAWADVTYNGSAYVLTGYGLLTP